MFCLYVDVLIEHLSGTNVGCHIDGVFLNNISYADDMVLLTPLSGARRKLIPVCESYALSHGPLYNGKKSEVMIFKFGNIYPTVVPPSKRCGPQESHSFQVSWAHRYRQSKGRRRHGEGKTARCEPRLRTRPLRFARCSNTVKLHCSKHIALRFTQAACGAVIPKSHIML